MAGEFSRLEDKPAPRYFPGFDPAGTKLGSGGGIAQLIVEAWRQTGNGLTLEEWLRDSAKLTLLAGGQSRRLPAYAAVSKILLPFKVLRGSTGQRLDQTLFDRQAPDYERVLDHAPAQSVALIASGDVFLRFGAHLPPFPEVDILAMGMWVKPEVARDFGVFFTRRDRPDELAFFLQKPSAEEIQTLSATHHYLVDTGMWLLSERAIMTLLRRCGWDGTRFANGVPDFYELYADLGLGLGSEATKEDPELRRLTCSVVSLPEAEFYHLGTNRQLIGAISALETRLRERLPNATGFIVHPDQHVQNSVFDAPLRRRENHTLWVENSTIPATWYLEHEHLLTNVPDNAWTLRLEPGVCLDFAPIGETGICVRPYGIDDSFKGALNSPDTLWLGAPVAEWFAARGIDFAQAGLDPQADIQQSAIFPCLPPEAMNGELMEWLFARQPKLDESWKALWLASPRLSAQAICEQVNLERLYEQRQGNLARGLGRLVANQQWNFIFDLDLQATADTFAKTNIELPPPLCKNAVPLDPLHRIHDRMLRSAIARNRGQQGWELEEEQAFAQLQELIIHEARVDAVTPRRNLLDDQIIWGRSPVRFDLAGGWSDTPPYCIEHGGKVLNLAVNLNGQPPIQVFAKLSPSHHIVLRSIDLGIEKRLMTYEEIADYREPGADFSLAKAALALAGFLPKFQTCPQYPTLQSQLEAFGGGIEISLLSAVPKGSGLGTSSILSATLLGVLSELCGLGWDRQVLFSRTLALEQMLTTGGGWQDQAGALYRGIKLIETSPGLDQKPTLRWLPEHLLTGEASLNRVLLYYTGITRLAKNILKEIVRGMFLNSRRHLDIVDEINAHAETAFRAIQTSDWDALAAAIRNSWELNQRLDSGTNPPAVQAILSAVEPHVAGAKLLGAGGGGYLLMFAKSEEAAREIRATLTGTPPNPMARFVDFSISDTGMQITRS
jgi:galactokinase/mevalonate kinase-like predicted kinase